MRIVLKYSNISKNLCCPKVLIAHLQTSWKLFNGKLFSNIYISVLLFSFSSFLVADRDFFVIFLYSLGWRAGASELLSPKLLSKSVNLLYDHNIFNKLFYTIYWIAIMMALSSYHIEWNELVARPPNAPAHTHIRHTHIHKSFMQFKATPYEMASR